MKFLIVREREWVTERYTYMHTQRQKYEDEIGGGSVFLKREVKGKEKETKKEGSTENYECRRENSSVRKRETRVEDNAMSTW